MQVLRYTVRAVATRSPLDAVKATTQIRDFRNTLRQYAETCFKIAASMVEHDGKDKVQYVAVAQVAVDPLHPNGAVSAIASFKGSFTKLRNCTVEVDVESLTVPDADAPVQTRNRIVDCDSADWGDQTDD